MKKLVILIVLGLFIGSGVFSYPYWVDILSPEKKLYGNYQMIGENGTYGKWHLYIGTYEGRENYFIIYDNGGKLYGEEFPWIKGWIADVTGDQITVEVSDEPLFRSVPSDWVLTGTKLVLDYRRDKNTLVLSNNGMSIEFNLMQYATNPKKGL